MARFHLMPACTAQQVVWQHMRSHAQIQYRMVARSIFLRQKALGS